VRVVCYVCNEFIAQKKADNFPEDEISHGLCDYCAHHSMAQFGLTMEEFLNGFKEPIVMVGPSGSIMRANHVAKSMLQKTSQEIVGFLGGDVFECEYALLPGGCGKTSHCLGCSIRSLVERTYKNQKGEKNVTCYLKRADNEKPDFRLRMVLTTEYRNDMVYLIVHDVSPN